MGRIINIPNRFENQKNKQLERLKNLSDEEIRKNGKPVLVLRCIEDYSDAPTNRVFFTKDYAYHVLGVGKTFLIMQTNFPELEARIEMNVIDKIFAGFGKQNDKDLKVNF